MKPKYLFTVNGPLPIEYVDEIKRALDRLIDDDEKSLLICLPSECTLEVKVFNGETVKDLPEVTVKYEGPGPHRGRIWK